MSAGSCTLLQGTWSRLASDSAQNQQGEPEAQWAEKKKTPEHDVKNTGKLSSLGCITHLCWWRSTVMVIQLPCSPEGISAVLFRKHSLILCALELHYLELKGRATTTENPQTHLIFNLLQCQLKLWFTGEKKRKEREGGNLETIFTIHRKTNKPSFPRNPKRMPFISPIKGGREKEFPFFYLARLVLPSTSTPLCPRQ